MFVIVFVTVFVILFITVFVTVFVTVFITVFVIFYSEPQATTNFMVHMSQMLLLGKFEYGGGPIFKVVLEC